MRTQIILITMLSITFINCGNKKILAPTSMEQAPKKLSKVSLTRLPLQHWTIASITVLKDGQPLEGVTVRVSRSISGQPHNYKWEGDSTNIFSGTTSGTDKYGWTQVPIRTDPNQFINRGATGYYAAQVIAPQTNLIIGEWNSLPLIDGQMQTIFLEPGKPARFISTEKENDIREALFRGQMRAHASSEPFFSLSLASVRFPNGEWIIIDPTDKFLHRFHDIDIPVIKTSQTEYRDFDYGVFDKDTGDRGIELFVTGLRWINDTEVVAITGYYFSFLGSTQRLLRLSFSDGKWIATELLGAVAS